MTFSGHLTDAQAQRLLEGALDPVRDAEVEAHAASCAGCQALLASDRALDDALDGLAALEPDLPDGFTDAVLARVDAAERLRHRERGLALGILGAAVAAAVAAFALAGARAWAPALSGWAGTLGEAARGLQISAGFLPTVVGALRLQIVLAAALLGLPLLLALARLIPAHRPETA